MWYALPRLRRRYGDGTSSMELGGGDWRKQRKEKERRRRRSGLYNVVKAQGDDAQQLLHASAEPKVATGAAGSQRKFAVGEVSPVGTVHNIYRIATRLISQVTPKFIW